jgi:hypothetical protein
MKNKGQRALRTTKPIGLDDRWGTLSVSNLTSATGVVPNVNGYPFYAEVPAIVRTAGSGLKFQDNEKQGAKSTAYD